MADALELRLILRISLDAETSGEDKLTDGGTEAGKEGVEGLYISKDIFFGVSASSQRNSVSKGPAEKAFKSNSRSVPFYRKAPWAPPEEKEKREGERESE